MVSWKYSGIISIRLYKVGNYWRRHIKSVDPKLQASSFPPDFVEDRKKSNISQFIQAFTIGKRYWAYGFLDSGNEKFSREGVWLCRTRAALFQRNAILASVESKRELICARIYRCLAAKYFVTRETEVKESGYSVLNVFADACNFPSVFLEIIAAVFIPSRNAVKFLYVRVQFVFLR